MKKKVIILLVLTIPFAPIFYSCVCDVITKFEKYSHSTLTVQNLDNSGQEAVVTESSQINKNSYGIRIIVDRDRAYQSINSVSTNSLFIQSVQATSIVCPPEYEFSPKDSIVSLKVFTVNKFDGNHSENSEITEYFRTPYMYKTVNDVISNLYYFIQSDFEFEKTEEANQIILDLLLMKAPEVGKSHQFKIQIELSDGRILEQLTPKTEMI